jgi:hypothetical protein
VNKTKKQNLPINYSIDKDFKSDKFIKLRMRICHDGINYNNSKFTIENLEEKKDSLANSPILAYMYFDENGDPQFGEHNFEIEKDKVHDGEAKIIYTETPVGVIPETNNFEVVNEDDINYIYADGYIWKKYSNYCEDILNRYDEIRISMEVNILAYSYNTTDNVYDITDFNYAAVTLLNEGIDTGMKNARATIETFSQSVESKKDLSFMMQELNKDLADNKEDFTKGDVKQMDKELIENILKEYKMKIDDISFDITDDMTEETFRSQLETMQANSKGAEDGAKPDDKFKASKIEAPVTMFATVNQKREMIRNAIPKDSSEYDEDKNLVKSVDYWLEDFDDNYVYMSIYSYERGNGSSSKMGRFAYSIDEAGVVTIDSNYVEVFRSWVTAEEMAALDALKEENSKLKSEVDELNEYKETVEKEKVETAASEIFNDFENELSGVDEFSLLKSEHDGMTAEQISAQCYMLLGKKNKKSTKATKESKTVTFSLNGQAESVDEPWYKELYDKYGK